MMKTAQTGGQQNSQVAQASPAALLYSGRPPQTESPMARMQHACGNQRMLRMANGGVLQRKLTINQPGDAYEQEADRVADTVMRMPDPARDSEAPLETSARSNSLLQRCSCSASPTSGGDCEDCKSKAMNLQRSSNESSASAEAPPIVHDVLRSSGQPLDSATRSFMEPRFGADFSNVRVHTDAKAAESAKSVNALAYAVGNHIAFGPGQFASGNHSGRHLLAHELSHVVQQGRVTSRESVQRAGDEDGSAPLCHTPTPVPPLEQWSADSTLNGIRSEAVGDNRVLVHQGQRGDTVQLVQQGLLAWGCERQNRNLLAKFGTDGDFGAETERAVHSFQSAMGIAQDGLVGPLTLSRLDAFVAFGTIPEFPSINCKVIPIDVPADVIHALAGLGFAASAEFASADQPTGELGVSAGIAGVPILCQVGGSKGGGGGGGGKAPAGICPGKPQHVASIGNATFALCEFTNGSRMTAGAIPSPRPGREAGFVEMRALGIALFGSVGSSLPTTGPGSAGADWQHGFIQTVRSLKYTATYQRGWTSVREVASARRDATGSTVAEPWYSNQSIPGFQFQVGNQIITEQGPIALGPESIGTDPVGIIDDPRVIFVDTVPINKDPVCPCSFLQAIEAKGELDNWLVVTPAGKGKIEADLAFLKHVAIAFDLKADKASGFAVQGAPTMKPEKGRGSNAPVLTGSLANDDLKAEKITTGAACPVTIPSVKCPVESPKGPPTR